MNIIEHITVSRLWGTHDVELPLRPDVTFLIGRNGTGKTTVINLVVAALLVDFPTLLKIEFSSITVGFKSTSGPRKPSIQVTKSINEENGTVGLKWVVKSAKTAAGDEFFIEDVPERAYMQRSRLHAFRQFFDVDALKSRMSDEFSLSWLSILRAQSVRGGEAEEPSDSTVDAKLRQMANDFVRFFSELGQQAASEMRQFQEAVFLSLLATGTSAPYELLSLDLETEKTQLSDIYKQLEVKPAKFLGPMTRHFDLVSTAVANSAQHPESVNWNDAQALILSNRTHLIVQQWNAVKKRQEDIYRPQRTFLEMLNQLMVGKRFFINPKNELAVELGSDVPLSLQSLSSGEKQMLIILGEALLQASKPTIYIADEPELSLHVEWQESLVDNVRCLNPSAQILFATHSPDIVSSFGENVIEISAAIS